MTSPLTYVLRVDPDEVRGQVSKMGLPLHAIDDQTAFFACEMASTLVAAFLRLPADQEVTPGIEANVVPIVRALACRIAVNATGLKRLSYDVEGASFSFTPGEAGFTIAERLVLNRYRRRTA